MDRFSQPNVVSNTGSCDYNQIYVEPRNLLSTNDQTTYSGQIPMQWVKPNPMMNNSTNQEGKYVLETNFQYGSWALETTNPSCEWNEPIGNQLNPCKIETGSLHQSFSVPPSPCEFQYYPAVNQNDAKGVPYGYSLPPFIPNDPTAGPYSAYNQLQEPIPSVPQYGSRKAEVQTPMNPFSKQGTSSSTEMSTSVSSVKSRSRRKRPRLCHFILELLEKPEQYSNIVEWVDQKNGVFKFHNSSEIASQWGKRRDKPHMKYENFARSLRSYIAKGIMSKPRSRLVYRFTEKIL
ncbi:transcription factor Spi-B-like isoform X2 [Dendronephthya gigantea]|nr:transcription factor Spi-B-like isoform X2 [Dendronephthya gigantea]